MIYNLVSLLSGWLERRGMFGALNVFTYPEFRAVAAIVLSFAIVTLLGRRTITWLLRQKIGDNPEFYNKDLNALMKSKANTPTMGGILISGAILATTLLLADLTNFYVIMAMICLVWLCVLGGFDDWLKLTSAKRKPGSREGLYTWEKLLLQVGLAVLLGIFVYHHGQTREHFSQYTPMTRALVLPFVNTWQWDSMLKDFRASDLLITLPRWLFVLIALFVIVGASNAVNLTDGMDGLASGTMTIVALAFMILVLLAGYIHPGTNFVLAKYLLIPHIPGSSELAIVAGAMVGACLGFLWFNCSPAQVFMGDTGSLPLGGLIGYLAVVTRQEILLLIIGGIFVLEAVSVILQVGYFRFTGGKRIFKCAPIHHHFHLSGWTEQQVVVRFWLVTAILAATALATIKLR